MASGWEDWYRDLHIGGARLALKSQVHENPNQKNHGVQLQGMDLIDESVNLVKTGVIDFLVGNTWILSESCLAK